MPNVTFTRPRPVVKDCVVSIRFTPEEIAAVDDMAGRRGCSRGELIRAALDALATLDATRARLAEDHKANTARRVPEAGGQPCGVPA